MWSAMMGDIKNISVNTSNFNSWAHFLITRTSPNVPYWLFHRDFNGGIASSIWESYSPPEDVLLAIETNVEVLI